MSDTASFVDPVFLSRFGLPRMNVLDYFLHPLNPFRTKGKTTNELLTQQGISIGTLMAQGTGVKPGPIPLSSAEHEYSMSLSRHTGEQYELMLPPPSEPFQPHSNLYTIRHVLRTNPTTVKVLGIYYILEGVIYKAPCVRSLMKANVTRTVEGLAEACNALSACARYDPSTGYLWDFDVKDEEDDDKYCRHKWKRQRRVLDNRRPGEYSAEEEEGIRASEAVDNILLRLSKCPIVVYGKSVPKT
eukprot:CAMPEP_0172497016 /NCGR_PEP_ID=MMETSP1066-20121228/94750_1 /TAXON_ID=671091 /ORGANISM="Coscinodiscus wailesii, Strain CCMP2513" /LENGTH=243 /DNA_ID=CAMNT_0013269589 /DNA_START=57 /DNA_END=784 /DNA_ORIENTATION=+